MNQPVSSSSSTPFGIGQPPQFQSNATQQPSTFGGGGAPTGGTGNFMQPGSSTNPFGQTAQGGTVPSFGLAQPSATSSSTFIQPSRPLFGSAPNTGNFGLAPSSGGLFGRPSTGPLSFGQPGTSTALPPASPFGVGGVTAGTPLVQQNPQATQAFAESSKEYECVHRECLEKLRGVDWAMVSEGALFHELPEAVKSVLTDVSARLGAEEASLESARQESAAVNESLLALGEIVSEKSKTSADLSKKPALSEMVSSVAEGVRNKSDASMGEVEELSRTSRSFQTLVQSSLRGLLDAVSGSKGSSADRSTEDEDFSLVASVVHELEARMQWVLTHVQSLAIQWPEPGESSVWSLRRIVDGLRAVMSGVGERFRACHSSVRGLPNGF
ncbi:hypothetical protein XU18_2536 [Perkinsela sp. CCAP 1560/4]|nr:hypothetical protein XU18_2536 [Perkinsela sp. CCAP 1560/4]|eukprot:KNH06635.1 hypothetical protein XU18_2536 [Perkinsela sp. CCAP 1560/4]